MKSLEEYIREELCMYMCEGFDINFDSKVVSFNPAHQDNVDTNDYVHPYVILNNLKTREYIMSLFHRRDNDTEHADGNPVVYALEGKHGWRFNNPKYDLMATLKRFVSVTKKLNAYYDTLLITPSHNEANKQVFSYLKRLVSYNDSFEEFFEKISLDEIYDNLDYDTIIKYAHDNGTTADEVHKSLSRYFAKMKKEHGGVFSYSCVPPWYRSVISSAIKLAPATVDNLEMYAEAINGKDVLVFDDTVASGKTLSDTAQAIRATFAPASITFITLFSPRDTHFENVKIELNE